jgi:hypothetical protein
MKRSFKENLIIISYIFFIPGFLKLPVGLIIIYYWHKKYVGEISFVELSKKWFKPNSFKIVLTILISIAFLLSLNAYSYFSCFETIKTLREIYDKYTFSYGKDVGSCKFSIIPFESGYVPVYKEVEQFNPIPFWIKFLVVTDLIISIYSAISIFSFYKNYIKIKF